VNNIDTQSKAAAIPRRNPEAEAEFQRAHTRYITVDSSAGLDRSRIAPKTHREVGAFSRTGRVDIGRLGGDSDTKAQPNTAIRAALTGQERALAFEAGQMSILQRNDEAMAARRLHEELCKPLPKVVDPATRCRVLTANFRHRERGGETYVPEVGDIITMPRTEALDAQALGRVSILKVTGANS